MSVELSGDTHLCRFSLGATPASLTGCEVDTPFSAKGASLDTCGRADGRFKMTRPAVCAELIGTFTGGSRQPEAMSRLPRMDPAVPGGQAGGRGDATWGLQDLPSGRDGGGRHGHGRRDPRALLPRAAGRWRACLVLCSRAPSVCKSSRLPVEFRIFPRPAFTEGHVDECSSSGHPRSL